MIKRKNVEYCEDLIGSDKLFEIAAKRTMATVDVLKNVLKDRPLKRKDVRNITGWTVGQLAGVLYRSKDVFGLKNGKIYLKK